MYSLLKQVHVGAAALSFALFAGRGWLMLAESPRLQHRILRVLPHVVDTILLVTGVALAYLLRQVPGVSPWLTAKLIALAIYIVLGSIALKRGKTKGRRAAATLLALAVFAYIVGVAIHKDIASWFSA